MKDRKRMGSYLLFLLSLLIMGIGISLVTKLELGTSAISSIPYVLSLIFPFSFGSFTFMTNIVFVLVQKLILGSKFEKSQYLQMLVGPFLGLFIDMGMNILGGLNPSNYIIKLLLLVLGCWIIALSIFLQLKSKVITNPGEGMVKAISIKMNIEFGRAKIMFDLILIAISFSLSYIFLNNIYGIREGTLVTAILVGFFVREIEKIYEKIGEGE